MKPSLLLLLTLGGTLAAAPAAAQITASADAATSAPQYTAAELASISPTLLNAAPGEMVNLDIFKLKDLPRVPYEKIVLPGPQFIFSDEPEYVRVPEGVALRERVEPGRVRLYMYNVNGVKEPAEMDRRLNAVIKNLGDGPLTLRFLRYSSQKPSGNYHFMGKNGLKDFLESQPSDETRTIAPGVSEPLDLEQEERVVKYNDLVHGFYEFLIDQPAQISVVQTSLEESTPEASGRMTDVLPIVRQKNAGRGLFGVSNYLVRNEPGSVLDSSKGAQELIVADGKSDPWVKGIVGDTGAVVELKGNYGVLYDVELEYTTPDGRGLALVTWNSRWEASQWCGGFAATVEVGEGLHEGGVVSVPSNQLVLRKTPEVSVIQVFPPVLVGETGRIRVRVSPPGASCLPMPLIFLPVEME